MRDALDVSAAPVIFSPLLAPAPWPTIPRNVPDDVLTATARQRRGLHGDVRAAVRQPGRPPTGRLAAEDAARDAGHRPARRSACVRAVRASAPGAPSPPPAPPLADVVAHVEHVRDVAGADHVGLGGDYDGVTSLPDGLEDVSRYPPLLEALAARGWSAEDLGKLTCRNALRVLRDVEDAAG